MNEKEILVYIDTENSPRLVGRLWHHHSKGRESSSFEYDRSWLKSPDKFALEPALMLSEGKYHTGTKANIFGSIGDSAPDRWGRVLMKKAEFEFAKETGRSIKTLTEADYLLMVNDELRQGALRFALKENGPFLSNSTVHSIPPAVEISKLINASERVINSQETYNDIQLLLDPGSSLGGARPKSCIIKKDGSLALAKFPRKDDYGCIEAWESVALTIAKKSGILAPRWQYEKISGKPVIIEDRFDRDGNKRIPFLSAMSMVGARDNETDHSYLEIADAIMRHGSKVNSDLKELYKRIALNVLISNTDDHLRNHGFLYDKKGWTLSPVYDINPTPVSVKPRILSLNIDFDNSAASVDTLLSVSEEFRLKLPEAKNIIKSISENVSEWDKIAKAHNISSKEIDYMSSAFEHDDLKRSLDFPTKIKIVNPFKQLDEKSKSISNDSMDKGLGIDS
jgi:serine/threonine-protein kinase HipA